MEDHKGRPDGQRDTGLVSGSQHRRAGPFGMMIEAARLVLDAVQGSFSPPSGAPSRQVRINGAITLAVAVAVFVLAFGLLMVIPKQIGKLVLLPVSLALYVLLPVGAYRLVFGRSPRDEGAGFSAKRVAFVIVFLGGLVLLPTLLLPMCGPL